MPQKWGILFLWMPQTYKWTTSRFRIKCNLDFALGAK
jgi:hypothetical protein